MPRISPRSGERTGDAAFVRRLVADHEMEKRGDRDRHPAPLGLYAGDWRDLCAAESAFHLLLNVRAAVSKAQARKEREKAGVVLLLAWIAGGVDAIGYLVLLHLFTAHMSGNS